MPNSFRRSLSIALAALATTTLGGCYYGDVYGSSYAGGDCATRYGADYYDSDGYAYDDGYGYDCYDGADYSGGFAQIGFGGGWYDNYYYPGYGMWLFDSYRNRYPLRGQYLDYWGGRRAWWKHHGGHGDGNWNRPGHGKPGDGKPGRPGGWQGRPDRGDGHHGTRPGRGPDGANPGTPPTTTNPGRPDRGPGAGRPWRDRPAPGTGTVNPTPEQPQGVQRPPRNWSPGNGPRTHRAPVRDAPGNVGPGPRPQAAPVTRSAPPPSAPRAERPAPRAERSAPRFERPSRPDNR